MTLTANGHENLHRSSRACRLRVVCLACALLASRLASFCCVSLGCRCVSPARRPVSLACRPVLLACRPVSLACRPVLLACRPVSLACRPVLLACRPVSLACRPVLLACRPVSLACRPVLLACRPVSLACRLRVACVSLACRLRVACVSLACRLRVANSHLTRCPVEFPFKGLFARLPSTLIPLVVPVMLSKPSPRAW